MAYQSMWLLVLWRGCESSTEVWALVRALLVELCDNAAKLTVRVARWSSSWRVLRSILASSAPDHPGCCPPRLPSMALDKDETEETEHESFLSCCCGLNPWAARFVIRHYSLCEFLRLQPKHRSTCFPWVSERSLRQVAIVADDIVAADDPAALLQQNIPIDY